MHILISIYYSSGQREVTGYIRQEQERGACSNWNNSTWEIYNIKKAIKRKDFQK